MENINGLTVRELMEFLSKCNPDKVVMYTHRDMMDYEKAQNVYETADSVILEDICK